MTGSVDILDSRNLHHRTSLCSTDYTSSVWDCAWNASASCVSLATSRRCEVFDIETSTQRWLSSQRSDSLSQQFHPHQGLLRSLWFRIARKTLQCRLRDSLSCH